MHIYPINLFISDTSDTVIRGILLLRRTSAAVCDVMQVPSVLGATLFKRPFFRGYTFLSESHHCCLFLR